MRVPMILAMGALGLAFTVRTSAQVQSNSATESKGAVHQVQVLNAEVVRVDGNDLVVKMQDGSIQDIPNVPESARATVDGKEIGIHDLRPGMHLQKTITTSTEEKMITTTQTVSGKVWHVNPPNSVILTMENGQNQEFQIPKGQKFTVNGQQTDAFGLRKGMLVSATKVVEEPVTEVREQARVTGHTPPPPVMPAADMPMLIVIATPARPPTTVASAEPAPKALPATGGELPLVGLLGLLSLGGFAGIRQFRTSRRQTLHT